MCEGKEMPSIGGKQQDGEKAYRNHIWTITDRGLSGREQGTYSQSNGGRDDGYIYL